MEIKERLAVLLKNEGLTSSKLAEMLEVQPSSISHLMAGRNKPGFDFLAKMMQSFPKINPDWLILGEGPVYRESVTQDRDNSQATLFSEMPEDMAARRFRSSTVSDRKNHVSEPLHYVKYNETEEELPSPSEVAKTPDKVAPDKIAKIIVCYEDETFALYNPRKGLLNN